MKILGKTPGKSVVIWLLALVLVTFVAGFWRYSKFEVAKEKLQLDSIFANVQGVKIKTEDSSLFSDKPYKSITIDIPSLASRSDDTIQGQVDTNQIIDRESFDKRFIKWLHDTYNKGETKKYTDEITINYRDQRVIHNDFSKK